jgi:glycosyltransferase involved in cell wall biosynthesis
MERELRSAIERNGLEDRVRLLGVRDDIPELLNGSDVFLLPSLVEGFPVVLVEAQAAGIGCLVSDRVSAEVDLGMGLLAFLPVPEQVPSEESERCAAEWADALGSSGQAEGPSASARLQILETRGYSILAARDRLLRLYDDVHFSGSK